MKRRVSEKLSWLRMPWGLGSCLTRLDLELRKTPAQADQQWPLEPTGLGNTRFSSMDLRQEPLLMDAPPRGAEAGAKV